MCSPVSECTIQHASEGGITAELFCTYIGCGESSAPQGDPGATQDWALMHTAAPRPQPLPA
ncbi:DUF7848 domain-containing protein [Streptomyces tuirus]|uniref:DUF7848 domain-containing protein n=1 Tax=Streptomyces tuirus TaxID=68278 RepID=UPI00406BAEA7